MGTSQKRKERRALDVGAAFQAIKESANLDPKEYDEDDIDGNGGDVNDGGAENGASGVRQKRRTASKMPVGGDVSGEEMSEISGEESEDYNVSDESELSDSEDDEYQEAVDMDADEPEDSEDGDNSMAMAEALGKVLGKQLQKPVAILSKAGRFEKAIEGEREAEREHRTKVRRTKALQQVGRVKPRRLGTDIDRKLARLATRGAVQLFNAVNDQQKVATAARDATKLVTKKKERDIKELSKEKFLNMLAKGGKEATAASGPEVSATKEDMDEQEAGPAYMRDDFMLKARAKDWGEGATAEVPAKDVVVSEEEPDTD